MKITNYWAGALTFLMLGSLPACTTVDLSQVAVNTKPTAIPQQKENVVARSCQKLASLFSHKGWIKNKDKPATQHATNILLHGLEKTGQNDKQNQNATPKTYQSVSQINSDIMLANAQIQQTTKAAEVFLAIAAPDTSLEDELSQLETTFLTVKSAQIRFENALEQARALDNNESYNVLTSTIAKLKDITDEYGTRVRAQIMAQSSAVSNPSGT